MPRPQPDRGFAWADAPWGAVLECAPLAAAAPHFFTAGDLILRDDRAEWDAVASRAGVPAGHLLLMSQVHGAAIADASAGRARPWPRPEADILISDDPGSAIVVRVADCVPILLAEETGRAVAAVHAGWRGLVRRAPAAAVDGLRARYGVRPDQIIAAIGPAIGACCYEVGPEVREAFVDAGHGPGPLARWFRPHRDDRLLLDTGLAARHLLEEAGIPSARIHAAGLCTKCHPEIFHSYRVRGAEAGRMAGVIRARA